MINYFDLFETLYSNLPESAKVEVLENISEEFSKSIKTIFIANIRSIAPIDK